MLEWFQNSGLYAVMLLALFSYIFGAMPFHLWLQKWFAGENLRWIAFAASVAKGFVPTLIAKSLGFSELFVLLVALMAFTGHQFPIWVKRPVGKGFGVWLGIILGLSPIALLMGGLFVAIAYWLTKKLPIAFAIGGLVALLASLFFLESLVAKTILTGMFILLAWRYRRGDLKEMGE